MQVLARAPIPFVEYLLIYRPKTKYNELGKQN